MKKYGLMIGRFQPLHAGHMATMNYLLDNGYSPIVVMGSSNRKRNVNRNPLNFEQRKALWELAYPSVKFSFVRSEDHENDEDWVSSVLADLVLVTGHLNFKEITLFSHNKKEDRKRKSYRGMPIEFDSDMFKYEGLKVINLPEATNHIQRKQYSATAIRHNFAKEVCSVHPAVYSQLIDWGWK